MFKIFFINCVSSKILFISIRYYWKKERKYLYTYRVYIQYIWNSKILIHYL